MRCQKCGFDNNETARFCRQCGTPQTAGNTVASMPAASVKTMPTEAFATTTDERLSEPDAGKSLSSSKSVTGQSDETCLQCGTARIVGKRFCRQCRFDFFAENQNGSSELAPSTTDRASIISSGGERSGASTSTASSAVEDPDSNLPRENAYVPESANSVAESREHVMFAPSANTSTNADHASSISIATRDIEPNSVASTEAISAGAAQNAAVSHAAPPADVVSAREARHSPSPRVSESHNCPTCSALRAPGKRFCRSCGFDFGSDSTSNDATIGHLANTLSTRHLPKEVPAESTATESTVPQSPGNPSLAGAANFMPQSETQASPRANNASKNKLLFVASGVVVLVGIALVAGVLLRGRHPAQTGESLNSGDSVASAAVVPAVASAVSVEPPVAVLASPAPAASAPVTTPPVTDANIPSPASAAAVEESVVGASAVEQTQLSPSQPATSQTAVATTPVAPAAPRPPEVRPKVRKQAETDENAFAPSSSQNATIRAAIAGNLNEGEGCYAGKKFDCAISNADAVLRLDPRNSEAIGLRRRAKSAQAAALDNVSIE